LVTLGKSIEAGKIVPLIDRTYPLGDAAEAFRYLDEGHARGKVVIGVFTSTSTRSSTGMLIDS
jgi:NADPH:quinone reductase-like Zn-dependent oxidoreductase